MKEHAGMYVFTFILCRSRDCDHKQKIVRKTPPSLWQALTILQEPIAGNEKREKQKIIMKQYNIIHKCRFSFLLKHKIL